jgi:hypothetical protein
LAPVGFGPLVAGAGFGDGEVGHEVAGCGAMPVPLVGGGVNDVACADFFDLAAAGLVQAAAFGDIEGLADAWQCQAVRAGGVNRIDDALRGVSGLSRGLFDWHPALPWSGGMNLLSLDRSVFTRWAPGRDDRLRMRGLQ